MDNTFRAELIFSYFPFGPRGTCTINSFGACLTIFITVQKL